MFVVAGIGVLFMKGWEKPKRKRIVVDANIIIAALFGSQAIVIILTSQNYDFYAPKYIINEIKKHKEEICKEAGKLSEDFDTELNALLKFIILLDEAIYIEFMNRAEQLMEKRDIKDAIYIATALTVKANFIWSNDRDFRVQEAVSVKNTIEFIEENR